MQHNTLPKHDQKLPFTRYDFGWVLLCIGMAIGAGTVLMPVQIGLKGIWVFITAAIIAYPATWVVQDIYLKTLSESDSCNDYTDIISHYLGKNWGIFLGVIYFLMIIHGIFIYSLSVVFDSASYLKTFGLTMPIFHNLYFIKSPFSPYWWQLRLVVNDYCLRFPDQWWWSK